MSKPGLRQRINECRDKFDSQWSKGSRPDLHSFLEGFEENELSEVYRHLLEVDVEHRRQKGELIQLDDYSIFPDFISITEQVVGSSADLLNTMDVPLSGGSKHPTSRPKAAKYYGHYRVIETLGEGGMGAVYLAHDESLERKVAVKVPFIDRGDSQAIVDRFYREAKALAAIVHPNICPIHEVNRDANIPYMVMTFVQGKPLSESEVQPKEIHEVVMLIKKLARALHHAHQVGVIHRDLKPSNIVIDHMNEPVIIDFGLAAMQRRDALELTADGAIIGTPSYMSPEQFDGRTEDINDKTDMFTLGVIFYELLTGTRPFSGENIYQIRDQVVQTTPDLPSTRREGINQELDEICAKAMAKEIGARYSRMSEFADHLEEWLEKYGPGTRRFTPEPPAGPVKGGTMMPGTKKSTSSSRETASRTKTVPLSNRNFDFEPASNRHNESRPSEGQDVDQDKTAPFHPEDYGYKLIEQIGKGQYGEVWKATAPGDVEVAIKRLRYPKGHRATEAEIRALQLVKCLTHPMLLNVQAYWLLGDRLMSVSELADESLEDKLKGSGNGIPRDVLLGYMHETAEAIDYLHSQNIYHRDIKPANILLQKEHVKLADFGIAVSGILAEGEHTVACSKLGTPIYMAPELHDEQVGPSSDQYSLAITYVELRTSAEPVDENYVPVMGDIPEEERVVLEKALSKDPADRYSSCLEFVGAIKDSIWALAEVQRKQLVRRRAMLAGVASLIVGVPSAMAFQSWRQKTQALGYVPEGFEVPAEATMVDLNGDKFYSEIVRVLGNNSRLRFLLIPESSAAPDVAPFYCMENLVTNSDFAYFASKADGSVGDGWRSVPSIGQFDEWKAEDHPNAPVIGMTANEAYLFATSIGSDLPTKDQWHKAAGRWDHSPQELGPYKVTGDSDVPQVAVYQILEGNGPVDVGSMADDESIFGCRDMAGNVKEWTKTTDDADSSVVVPFNPEDLDYSPPGIYVLGHDYKNDEPLKFDDMGNEIANLQSDRLRFGFRCVVRPAVD